MRTVITILLLFGAFIANAQTPFQQIVNAELNFKDDCLEMGIKKGFLANMDSTAVAFTRIGIENARKYWRSLPEFPGIYSWLPSYAEVSNSGTWGYTTGAVEYRDSLLTDPPSSYNQYTTVWHKNKKGEWKYLVDIGNSHGPVKIDSVAREVKIKKVSSRNTSRESIIIQDKMYAEQFEKNAEDAIRKFYSKSFILNASGHAATTVLDSALMILKAEADSFHYEPFDAKISSSGDMGVIYGNIRRSSSKEHYIRVWRNEATGWKIALEVARL